MGWWCAFPRIPPTAINSSGGEVGGTAPTHTHARVRTHVYMVYAHYTILERGQVQVVLLAKGDDRCHIHAPNRRAVHLADTRVPSSHTYGICVLVHVDACATRTLGDRRASERAKPRSHISVVRHSHGHTINTYQIDSHALTCTQ